MLVVRHKHNLLFLSTGSLYASESEIYVAGHTSVTRNTASSPGGETLIAPNVL